MIELVLQTKLSFNLTAPLFNLTELLLILTELLLNITELLLNITELLLILTELLLNITEPLLNITELLLILTELLLILTELLLRQTEPPGEPLITSKYPPEKSGSITKHRAEAPEMLWKGTVWWDEYFTLQNKTKKMKQEPPND